MGMKKQINVITNRCYHQELEKALSEYLKVSCELNEEDVSRIINIVKEL